MTTSKIKEGFASVKSHTRSLIYFLFRPEYKYPVFLRPQEHDE